MLITQGKSNIKYLLIVVILAVIVGGGILGYIKIPEIRYLFRYWTCDKLEKLKSLEFNKLDFSCETDADCTTALGRATFICVNVNTDTKKHGKILSTMIEKGCLPLYDRPAVKCKCLNNKCESHPLTVAEVIISSPIKGEVWIAGEIYQIRWAPSDPAKTVGIVLSDTRIPTPSLSKVWQIENIPDTGIYSFAVPEVSPGDAYQIYISSKEKYGYSKLFSIISKPEFIESGEAICEKWLKECAKEGESRGSVCGIRNCCLGLLDRYVTHPWMTENNEVVCLKNMGGLICVKCGDGICGEGEDWCICPEDCPKPNPEDLEFGKTPSMY